MGKEIGSTSSRSGYRPELDGVRALAIVCVMVFHGASVMSFKLFGGMFGVDLFFVLSGFLITSILVSQWQRRDGIDLRRFFARRVLRLWPALLVAIAVGAFAVAYLGKNPSGIPFWKAAVSAFGGFANWMQASPGNKLGLFNHTWSLSIEWQYYLVWPPVLYLALRGRLTLRTIAIWTAIAAVAVAATRALVYHQIGAPQALFWTVTRSDAILLGSALALAVADERSTRLVALLRRHEVGVIGVIGGVVGIWRMNAAQASMYDGVLFAVIVCFAMAVGHAAVRSDGVLAKVLSTQPLPAIGRISYGLYLFHVPVYAVLLPNRRGPGWVMLAAAATFAVAIASYVLVERPALAYKSRIDTPAPTPEVAVPTHRRLVSPRAPRPAASRGA